MINREALKLAVMGSLWFGRLIAFGLLGGCIIAGVGLGVVMLLNYVATSIGGSLGILASLSIVVLLFMILAGIAIYFIEARRM